MYLVAGWAPEVIAQSNQRVKRHSNFFLPPTALLQVHGLHLSDLTGEEVLAARALIAAQTTAGGARCVVSMSEGCIQINLEMYSLMRQGEAESQPEDLTWMQLSDGDIIRECGYGMQGFLQRRK